MSFRVLTIPPFDKQLKRLSRKYPSFGKDYEALINLLEENPIQGIPLGGNFYKIRMAIASKAQGKSGGARVVTCVYQKREEIYLAAIFDKSEHESISDEELAKLKQQIVRAQ